MTQRPHILVIGAGILGASIGWHAIRRGARVTIVEMARPGSGATRHSWAWINASWGNPEHYVRFRIDAMSAWRRLERDLPALRVHWTGGLNWELPPDRLELFAAEHGRWGYDVRLVDRAEALRIEPALARPPDLAVHAGGEASVDALEATRALLAAILDGGATVLPDTAVEAIIVEHGRAVGVRTPTGTIRADRVVVAAGAGAPALLAPLGFVMPVEAPPGLIVTSAPHERLLQGMIFPPFAMIRQDPAGRIVVSADAGSNPGGGTEAACAILAQVQDTVRSAVPLVLERHVLARRPIPIDGLPIMGSFGAVPGLSVAVTHSGVTLAALLGQLVADEILDDCRDPLLAPYRPERFEKSLIPA